MITTKQRAFLRSLANTADTILIVGKGGITEQVIKQADDALTARELIKGKVLETCENNSKEVANALAESINCDIVQVIGSKFVLYRENKKDPKIILPKAAKK